jgi:hypothetical protein
MADNYKISRERLENIADRVRVMAGLTRKMTPAEIVDWLCQVKFMPMTVGESEFSLNFAPSTAAGKLPEVAKGSASSYFELNFTSDSVGMIPNVVRGVANSMFALNFISNATGELQEE